MGATRRKIKKTIVNNFKLFTWMFWSFQVALMLLGVVWLIWGHSVLGVGSIIAALTCHALTAKFRRYVIEDLQDRVKNDPMYGLPGRVKRNIRRKIARNGSV